MAAIWTLGCKNCGKQFKHSDISDTLSNMYIPAKPLFPVNGLEMQCPRCHKKFTYLRTELIYEEI